MMAGGIIRQTRRFVNVRKNAALRSRGDRGLFTPLRNKFGA